MKKNVSIILAFITIILLFTGCDADSEFLDTVKEQAIDNLEFSATHENNELAKDVLQTLKGEDEEHVLRVRHACPPAYPDITYDESFKYFFDDPSWEYYEAYYEENEDVTIDVVEFTGGCVYMDEPVTALIQFELSKTDDTFFPIYLTFNDVPQNEEMLGLLLESAFDDYKSNS